MASVLARLHLWRPALPWMKLPPLDVRVVTAFELQADIQLPPTLLQLLAEQNGGELRYDAFPCDDRSRFPEGFVRVPHLRGVGLATGAGIRYGEPEQIAVLCAHDDGLLGLDYGDAEHPLNPPVVWVDALGRLKLAPDFETFARGLTRSDEDFLIGLMPAEADDHDDVPDAFLDQLEREAPEFEEVEAKDDIWLLHHKRWASRMHSDRPASIVLRSIDVSRTDDPEFPEVPDARWVLELDLKPDNVKWLEQRFREGPVRLIRIHTPVT
ncbi:MAG: hypothetical protein KGO50_02565 [Myxococcales bacterium]|nr:hypothetical protein [Myxococcales bacterium]